MSPLLLLTILFGHLIISATAQQQYPPCAYATLDITGTPNIGSAMYNCSKNILNAYLIPSYGSGSQPVEVFTQLVLNNLISISEIDGLATFDFYLRFTWRDGRWNIQDLWDNVKEPMRDQGIEISPFWKNTENSLPLWTPDIMFQDAIEFKVISETLKFQQNETFYWSRHCVMSVVQSEWKFHEYPMDSQSILLRFYSFAFSDDFLSIELKKPPLLYMYGSNIISDESQKSKPGTLVNFEEHQVWGHKMNDYTAVILHADTSVIVGGKFVKRFSYNFNYIFLL